MTLLLNETSTELDNTEALGVFDHAGPDLAEHYRRYGFSLLGNALTPAEVAAVNADAVRLCRGDYGAIRYGHEDAQSIGRMSPQPKDVDDLVRRVLCIHFPP
jgi:phytanoyl-CoA hydroxylase